MNSFGELVGWFDPEVTLADNELLYTDEVIFHRRGDRSNASFGNRLAAGQERLNRRRFRGIGKEDKINSTSHHILRPSIWILW